ncbi:hypothetical protein TGRH88_039780 [Toxoplasma gondii]|uniref:Uncharacterized protein n=1 Tax=Toxoplasma gondii TaxID=5811 RepID=A0A7J6JXY7_TOXGO|nr:hypothetical protein TGRH88_039780 [Toxoplasma gondii]
MDRFDLTFGSRNVSSDTEDADETFGFPFLPLELYTRHIFATLHASLRPARAFPLPRTLFLTDADDGLLSTTETSRGRACRRFVFKVTRGKRLCFCSQSLVAKAHQHRAR